MSKQLFKIVIVFCACIIMFFDVNASNSDIIYSRFGLSVKEENELKTVVEKFVKKNINEKMTDIEKEITIVEYIISNVKVDSLNYFMDNIPTTSLNAYGALVKGNSICEGYADAFNLLCKASGLTSEIVRGKVYALTPTGTEKWINHSWNRVMLDGEYYNVDVMWEDNDDMNILQNEYINLTDQELRKDHKWSGGRLCTSKKYGKELISAYLNILNNNK